MQMMQLGDVAGVGRQPALMRECSVRKYYIVGPNEQVKSILYRMHNENEMVNPKRLLESSGEQAG